MTKLTTLQATLIFVASLFLSSGCAVVSATKQPSKKNLSVLTAGTPRALVVAEFGAPVTSEIKDSKRVEIYSFQQGYSEGAKVSRAIGHGVADVATLGLWEIVGTPTEAVFNGVDMVVQVTYDKGDKVESATTLKQR